MPALEEKLRLMARGMEAAQKKDAFAPLQRRGQTALVRRRYETPLESIPGGKQPPCGRGVGLMLGGDGEQWELRRTIFLDTETTGLSGGAGTLAFLIGIGYARDGVFVVEQFFVEDYDREPDALLELSESLKGFAYLVTYNGKTFDIPILNSRSIINRVRLAFGGLTHIDLLHAARRLWKKRLGQCGLQNVEAQILGMRRQGDIPGAMVPALFYEFLNTGDFTMMQRVLEHNRTDITSLYGVLCALSGALSNPLELTRCEDIYSAGRIFARAGEYGEALACFARAGELNESLCEAGLLYKRLGRQAEANAAFEALAGRGAALELPYEELAKYYEHVKKDYAAALYWARRGAGEGAQRRVARLTQKIEREAHR